MGYFTKLWITVSTSLVFGRSVHFCSLLCPFLFAFLIHFSFFSFLVLCTAFYFAQTLTAGRYCSYCAAEMPRSLSIAIPLILLITFIVHVGFSYYLCHLLLELACYELQYPSFWCIRLHEEQLLLQGLKEQCQQLKSKDQTDFPSGL